MYYVVLAIHVIVSLFLVLVVLLQSGRSGDLASAFGGGGGSSSVFGPRAAGNVLTKLTMWCAGIFVVTSILLVLMSQSRSGSRLNLDAVPSAPTSSAPASKSPGSQPSTTQPPASQPPAAPANPANSTTPPAGK